MVETKLIKAPINSADDMKQWLAREALRDAASKAMYKDHTILRAEQLAAKLGAKVGTFNIIQKDWNSFVFHLAASPLVQVKLFMNYQPHTRGAEHMMSVKVRSLALSEIAFSDRSEVRWYFNAGAKDVDDVTVNKIFSEVESLMQLLKSNLERAGLVKRTTT
jgi:hypothetical protein